MYEFNVFYFLRYNFDYQLSKKTVLEQCWKEKKKIKKWETVEKFRRAQVEVVNLLECKLNLMKVLW